MGRALVGTRENVQPAEDYLRTPGTIPVRQFERTPGKRKMYGDPHHPGHRTKWRSPVEQVLVPVLHAPMLWSGRGKAGKSQRRREHVLAEARIAVLRIERINQERIVRLDRPYLLLAIERRRCDHFAGNPALRERTKEGFVGCDHECTLYYKVLHVNRS